MSFSGEPDTICHSIRSSLLETASPGKGCVEFQHAKTQFVLRQRAKMLFLFILILGKQGAVLGDQAWWHAASTSYADPDNTLGQHAEFDRISLLGCSSYAINAPWTELFCCQSGRCLLSDHQVEGRYSDPSDVDETQCWTKYGEHNGNR